MLKGYNLNQIQTAQQTSVTCIWQTTCSIRGIDYNKSNGQKIRMF